MHYEEFPACKGMPFIQIVIFACGILSFEMAVNWAGPAGCYSTVQEGLIYIHKDEMRRFIFRQYL